MANPVKRFLALSNRQKVLYLLLLSAGIGGTIALFIWAGQPEFETLYAGLSQEDTYSIVEKLKERRIPYKLEGGRILIPQEKVYETRLELAASGLPSGGVVGFEIFEKTGFGMTEFAQKVNYLRALQGELARTISWLSEVETARVHIVIPERRLFTREEGARASVVVKLKPGRSLSPSQVQGIVHLVASSVRGLDPEDVTVVDTKGNMLTRAVEDGVVALSASQLEYRRAFERDMAKRIQGILEPIVGPGKVIARVSAEMDFKKVERTEERYDPDNVVVRSEQRSKEKTVGGMTMGVPGVASNLPGGQDQAGQASPPQTQKQDEVVNYEIGRVVNRVVEPSGVVKRLSVAVLVDGKYKVEKTQDGKEVKRYLPRSEEELKKFEELVKSAVGFSAERNDVVEVVSIPFESTEKGPEVEVEKAGIAMEFARYLPSVVRYTGITILAVLLFFFVLRPLMKELFRSPPQPSIPEEALPEALKALEEGIERKGLPSSSVDVRQRIAELVKENPQQAIQIIKAWLKEG